MEAEIWVSGVHCSLGYNRLDGEKRGRAVARKVQMSAIVSYAS